MGILEVHGNYLPLGIYSRPVTEGEEFDMVKQFIKFKKEAFQPTATKNMAIFVETKINNAYPDVIFAEYDPRRYEDWPVPRNNLTSADLKVLFFIYKKRNVTSQRLVEGLSVRYKSLLSSLEALWDAKLIERKNGAWIIANERKIFGVKRLEAIEAKIGKWETVLQQAIINTAFASESFVLSKRKKEPDVDVVQRMRNFGIGIYLYNNKEFSCYTRANRNHFPLNYNSIYLNECIGRVIHQ